jgi:CRISPR-associated endonuclease/helicase Cas3
MNDGQRQYIIRSLSQPTEDNAKSLVRFLAAIHDEGKATASFQVKEGFIPTPDLDAQLLERMERNGFKEVTVKSTAQNVRPHALAGQAILYWYGVKEDIASIIGGHHGKPLDYEYEYLEQTSYKENYFQVHDENDPIYKNWQKVQREILEWALGESGFEAVENLPNITQPGQVLLSGLLIMADWIASNEDFFPLIDIEEVDVPDQKSRLENGWDDWFRSYPWSVEYLANPNTLYTSRFNFDEPREEQAAFTKVIDEIEEPGIIVFEAPMGLGKTEAALVAVEQLAKKTGRSGLYFGLPTQATSNGIFPRIKDWVTSIQQESGDSYPIRLAHGKAALNDSFMGVSRNIDIDGDGSVFVNEWFSGRKTSALDEFVVGTVDQFLMVGLKQKHLALRHLGFSKKVIIIDEVHAYDIYS